MMNSDTPTESGPEFKSIQMGAPAATSEQVIHFANSSIKDPRIAGEELQQNQPLHAKEWNLPEELPSIPSDYTLGFSSAFIEDASPQVIADRIVQGLVRNSVAFSRHESQENSLVAEGNCGLRLCINLFQPGESDSKGTVVEVHRLIGCGYGFHLLSTGILKASQGISDSGSQSFSQSLTLPKCIPQDAEEDRKQCIRFDTQQALELVQSKRKDAQLLGLQSLERLSIDEYAASLLHNNESVSSLQSFLASDSPTCVMKRRALGVLANIMKFKPEGRCDKLQCQNFLKSLFTMLQSSATSPHEACAASRCLQSSLDALSQDKHDDLAQILQDFHSKHHSKLEHESKVLLNQLQHKQ